LRSEALHASVRSVTHDVVDQSWLLGRWATSVRKSLAVVSSWISAVIVHWLSWSICTEVSDSVGISSIIEILMNGFIAITVAINFRVSMEGVPETNAMSDFVSCGLVSSSNKVCIHPQSSSVGAGFWVPWEGSESEKGSKDGRGLFGDIKVEESVWGLSVDALHGLNLSVPCGAEWTVSSDFSITRIRDESGVDEVEGEVGSCVVFVDLADLSSDLVLGDWTIVCSSADNSNSDVYDVRTC